MIYKTDFEKSANFLGTVLQELGIIFEKISSRAFKILYYEPLTINIPKVIKILLFFETVIS